MMSKLTDGADGGALQRMVATMNESDGPEERDQMFLLVNQRQFLDYNRLKSIQFYCETFQVV